jgi:hypothetical protein
MRYGVRNAQAGETRRLRRVLTAADRERPRADGEATALMLVT